MEDKKISIIIPVFNAEKSLGMILEDLLNQTYRNFEIIIVNDGSTDNSNCVIEEYLQKDSRIISKEIKNQGPSKARNVGLDMATGDYIRFADSDDRIPDTSLEELIKPCVNDDQIDMVIGNYVCVPEKGYFTGYKLKSGKISQNELIDMFAEYTKTFYFGVPWNKLYKRDIIEKYKIRFEESINWCEDFLFNMQYFDKIKYAYITNVQNGIYQYVICDTGITVSLNKQKADEVKRIDELRYNKAREFFEKHSCLEKFETQWDFTELYKRLSSLTMYNSGKMSDRYKKFKEYLAAKGAYQYVCKMCIQINSLDWRLVKRALEKDKYLKVFCYFLIKGYICRLIPFFKIYFEGKNMIQ